MSELSILHNQLEYLGSGVSYIIAALLGIILYYVLYRMLVYIVKQGVKEALAESCDGCKKKK